MKMSIIHIVKQFYPVIGGLESYVMSLSIHQLEMGYTVAVITLNRDFKTEEKLPPYDELSSGLKIIRIPYAGMKKYPLAPGVIRHLKNYDVVHVHGVDFFIDYLSLTRFIHRKKLILTTHGGFFHTSWGHHFKKFYFNVVTRLAIQNYDVIIGCSDNDVKQFSRITQRIKKIENGVDVAKFLEVKKEPVRGTLLYVGRLDVHKGIDRLIGLTAALLESGKDIMLYIIGPDVNNLRAQLEKKVAEEQISDRVVFKGAVSDEELLKAFSKAWLFLSASEYEGFGISAVEAMASGTPCILNDIDSFRVFLDQKEFGSIVDFRDKESAMHAINSYLDLSPVAYRQISDKAREFSLNYNWPAVAKQITALY